MTLSMKAALVAAPFLMLGCSSMPMMSSAPDVPAPIAVPAGNTMSMRTVGVGELTYECREKQGAAGTFEWTFVAPTATLWNANRTTAVGKYYGGPTWESNDGSKVTGKQLAIAPASNAGAIPLQLVQAAPATGTGAMQGVKYIQRLNTVGGVAPQEPCSASGAGQRRQVKYEADYVFYK
ncbi:MAG: DUF3455 domain-containing protein [Burkholderiaceae bacterium]|nr:DUF3455 domain-containing protein [Burkholderiaceae bacterium]